MTDIHNLRNIGIIAHIDAGKTTLSERILFYCQKIHRLGEVHDGAATMDFMPEEQERGITISSACTTCHWQDKSINLVDTPGHVDFTMEVERCLRALDGAVGVFCAVGGVEPQSETVWRQSEHFHIPKLAFINKMDRQGANFPAVLQEMRDKLGANPIAMTIPLGSEADFRGVLDLLNNEKLEFDQRDQGQTVIRTPFTAMEAEQATPWRDELLEKLADADDAFLALWMDGKYGRDDILAALRRAVLACKIVPVWCGSALRNMGVQPLLDGICALLPSPADMPPAEGLLENGATIEVEPDRNAGAVALIFKVVVENARKNCFVRLYAGKIKEGETLRNSRSGRQERINRLYRIHADRREQLGELDAGDIAAIVGLADAATGDTYCGKGKMVSLEPITAQSPVITIALEAKNADESRILDEALNRYLQEDPTLKLVMDEETGLRMLSGMGELHLEVVLERLAREHRITPRSGQPQVVLRETPTASASSRHVFDRELGKERHYGEVAVTVEPLPRNSGTVVEIGEFLPKDPQEARKIVPDVIVNAVREGIADSLQSGVLGGWPVVDACVRIEGIGWTENQTTLPGARMAASLALRDALEKSAPVTLEPLMEVEIGCPDEFLGGVINLFQQTGGRIENMTAQGQTRHLSGLAPLRKLFGFSTSLRSATQGKAAFTQKFKTFDRP